MLSRLLAMVLLAAALAQPVVCAAEELPAGRWWTDPRLIQHLKITPAEIDQLDALFLQFRGGLTDLKRDVQQQQVDLDALLTRGGAENGALQQQFRRVEDGRSRLSSERLRFTTEVRRILGVKRFQLLQNSYRDFR